MYIFITYGYPGMRGVQTKALRLGQFLVRKGQKVKFYDEGDHKPLIERKVDYENWDFNALYLPSQITFPSKTKAVIFPDLPTNRIGQLAIFLSAKSQKIPTVVIDNFYRTSQLEDRVFSNVIKYADLVILNGLILPALPLPPHLKIIGPFIPSPDHPQKVWKWLHSLGIKKNQKIILGAGYNKDVLLELKRLAKKIKDENLVIIAPGSVSKIKRLNNLLYLPFLNDQEISNLLSMASLAIYKFGFIQVCEALMVGVPVVVAGKMRGFRMEWLDSKIRDLVVEALNSNQLVKVVREMIKKGKDYKEFQKRLALLRLVPKNSLEITGELLKKLKSRNVQLKKEVAISFDDQKSLEKLKLTLYNHPFALPLVFSIPYFRPEKEKEREINLSSLEPTKKGEILKWGFQVIYHLSRHSFHSGVNLFPYFESLVRDIEGLLKEADSVLFIDKRVKFFIKPLLLGKKGGL